MDEIINVKHGNEVYVHQYLHGIYGSPIGWNALRGGFSKSYPKLEVECKKEIFDKDYKTKIILENVDKKIKSDLTYLATTDNFSFSESFHKINEMVDIIKKDFLFQLKQEAQA